MFSLEAGNMWLVLMLNPYRSVGIILLLLRPKVKVDLEIFVNICVEVLSKKFFQFAYFGLSSLYPLKS